MDEVVSVTDDKHYSLSKLVAESILFAKDLELSNSDVAGCRILRPGYFVNQETRDHLEAGNFKYVDPSEIDTSAVVEGEEIARELEVPSDNGAPSIFYGNITTLNSVLADLAKESFICMIADYAWNVCRKVLLLY